MATQGRRLRPILILDEEEKRGMKESGTLHSVPSNMFICLYLTGEALHHSCNF